MRFGAIFFDLINLQAKGRGNVIMRRVANKSFKGKPRSLEPMSFSK